MDFYGTIKQLELKIFLNFTFIKILNIVFYLNNIIIFSLLFSWADLLCIYILCIFIYLFGNALIYY